MLLLSCRALLAGSDDGSSDLLVTVSSILLSEHIPASFCLSQSPVCYEASVSDCDGLCAVQSMCISSGSPLGVMLLYRRR